VETTADGGAAAPTLASVLPRAVSQGGPVLASPRIVPVVWQADPLASDIDAFMSAFATTNYWRDMVNEYGVSAPVASPGVHIAGSADATVDDADIQALLTSRLDGTHPEYPAPDANTLYVFFYPPGTTVTSSSDATGPDAKSCVDFHGYHSSVKIGSGTEVPYAVVARCAGLPQVMVSGVNYVSAVASHEIIEAMTDPFPLTRPAYLQTDLDHYAWTLGTSGELGDLCSAQGGAFFTPADFPYTVQKIWSNAAAAAGRDPCVPQAPGTPYFTSAARQDDTVDLAGVGTIKSIHVPVGGSRDVVVDLFSESPTGMPWKLQAAELQGTGHLAFHFDKTTGTGGDHVTLTIKVLEDNGGGESFVIVSTLGTRKNLWFGAVTQ
jgi:hypothetical protein